MILPDKTQVAIVGAGPTGLSLACQFIRHGVDFVIIDSREAITPYSKAIGVHARTLEIFQQMELAEPAVKQGAIARKARFLVNGKIRGEFDFSGIGMDLSPFPFLLMLEQSKNERLLYDFIRRRGQNVAWQTELESFAQTAGGVKARIKTADGLSRTLESAYLVGCDGPKSLVRHSLGLAFAGSTFERLFYVADVRIDWPLSHDALHVCLSKETFVVFFPLEGAERHRIVGVLPEGFGQDEGDFQHREMADRIRQETQLNLTVRDVEWFSTYKVHSRRVDRFSSGRVFVAGDAAHIHSPAGAQGMNTGIQDAYNLAWKLALVLRGKASVSLLATYNEERLPNADRLLHTTDRIFEIIAGKTPWLAWLRLHVLPLIAGYLIRFDGVKRFLFPRLSQIGLHYRSSSLSRHDGDSGFNVRAGDRMPYCAVNGVSLYELLKKPCFHLLVFALGERPALTAVENELIEVIVLAFDRRVRRLFGASRPFYILLRPDNHIGLISQGDPASDVKAYMQSAGLSETAG